MITRPLLACCFAALVGFSPATASASSLLDTLGGALGNLGKGSVDGGGALTDETISDGLLEALRVGTERVVQQVGAADGFNADPAIHIPLPDSLKNVQSALQTVGMSAMADDLELKLNRAAEAAAPQAKQLFWDTIKQMSFDDARAIYDGPDDAATRYFEQKMSPGLAAKMEPIVDETLNQVGAIAAYDDMMGQYAKIPFMPDVKADLTQYGVDKAMEGIFHYVAIEEAAIRNNPAARTDRSSEAGFHSLPMTDPVCLGPIAPLAPVEPGFCPTGAIDSHAHVLGPFDAYPLEAERSYTPPPALGADYDAMLGACAMARGVLVQPSVYGARNDLVLDVVGREPDRLRAVVVADPTTDLRALRAMHERGARAYRVNVMFGGTQSLDDLNRLAPMAADLGWHAQVLMDVRALPDIIAQVRDLPVGLVFDHMGHCSEGPDHPGFRDMVRLAEEDRAWIKLSGPYRAFPGSDFDGAASDTVDALIDAVPERLLYGSDWPHVGLYEAMPDTAQMLRQIADRLGPWRQQVFVDNPVRLFGFV